MNANVYQHFRPEEHPFVDSVAYLLGESDGIAKTAEWAAGICGVNAEKIRELAALFHQNTTMLMAGWGMQRQQFGEQKHWMIVTLAAMLANLRARGEINENSSN